MTSQIAMLLDALAAEIDLCVHNQNYGHIQYLVGEIQRLSSLQAEREEMQLEVLG